MADDTLRDRVAGAIYGVQVKSARDMAERYAFELERIERVFTAATHETDRSVSILLFALAEDLMISAFKQHTNAERISGGWEGITSGNGVLATANDRITMLEILSWISSQVAAHLRLMKSIRNRFAHHADVNTFSDKKIMGWTTSMEPVEKPAIDLFPEAERSAWRKHEPRELFLMRGTMTIVSLVTDLAVLPAAQRYRVSPWDVVGGGEFDDLPEAIKELRRLGADALLRCMPPRA